MSKLLIVVCTQANNIEETAIYSSLEKQKELNKTDLDYFVYKKNKTGLSQRYNEIIKDPSNKNKTVLFVHDDVILEDIFLYEKLIESPYSITGLAGAKSFNKNNPKLAWHLSAPRQDLVGEVAHATPEGIWTTVFGPTSTRALTIDGLFISCKINKLTESNLEFDENFDFHFYDLAFCMRANSRKVTCGVLPIRVVHLGLGDSMLTPEWEQANTLFQTKYCK